MYEVIQTSRLHEQIVQQTEEPILKVALKPGDQLPSERELAHKFGVSRTAVRETMRADLQQARADSRHQSLQTSRVS